MCAYEVLMKLVESLSSIYISSYYYYLLFSVIIKTLSPALHLDGDHWTDEFVYLSQGRGCHFGIRKKLRKRLVNSHIINEQTKIFTVSLASNTYADGLCRHIKFPILLQSCKVQSNENHIVSYGAGSQIFSHS